MTRRFLDDVRADINAAIVPNAVGAITADVLRPLLIDSIDSSIDDEAVIGLTVTPVALPVTDAAWTIVPVEESVGGDAQFLNVDIPTATISTSAVAGYTYSASAEVSLTGPNNTVVELAILQNGVAVGYIGLVTLRGSSKPVSVQAYNLDLSSAASAPYSMAFRSVSVASATLNLDRAVLVLNIKPTNNP